MPRKYNFKDNELYSDKGGYIGSFKDGKNDKCFAIAAVCGHCGRGYFIPILFEVRAKDFESAIMLAKDRPRVKRDVTQCILGAKEITEKEYWMIYMINRHDDYLKDNKRDSDTDIERRIPLPLLFKINNFDVVMPQDEKRSVLNARTKNLIKNPEGENDIANDLLEKYDDRWVLQKYYAPIMQGTRIIYDKGVNFEKVLIDYYTQNTLHWGVKMHDIDILEAYVSLFGLHNSLGIGFSEPVKKKRAESEDDLKRLYTYKGEIITYEENGRTRDLGISVERCKKLIESPHIYETSYFDENELMQDIEKMVEVDDTIADGEKNDRILKLKKLCTLYRETGAVAEVSNKEILKNLKKDVELESVDDKIDKLSQPIQKPSRIERFNSRFQKTKVAEKNK